VRPDEFESIVITLVDDMMPSPSWPHWPSEGFPRSKS
jgi:hypothetical protein